MLDPVDLARLQFAVTALYHFLFVPLTLGLSFLLAIMESAYVMTGREIWRDATKFWGNPICRKNLRLTRRVFDEKPVPPDARLAALFACTNSTRWSW